MRLQLACGCCEPPLWVDTLRAIECVGPLVGDTSVSGHTTGWRWDVVRGSHYNGGRAFGGQNVPSPQWTFFPYPPPFASLYKMQPMRFSARVSTDYYGVGSGGPSRRQGSRFTPPATADGHFSGSRLTRIDIGQRIMTANLRATCQIVAARVLIDGADVSGVVTLSPAIGFPVRSNNALFGWNSSAAFTILLPSPVTVSAAETIEFDLWAEMQTEITGSLINYSETVPDIATLLGGAPLIAAHGSFAPYTTTGFGPIMTSGQINVHRTLRRSDTWTVTFTGGTVGGVSSLVMQPQTGWSYFRQGPLISMTKTSGTGAGDQVSLRYDTETPEMIVRLQSQFDIESGGAGGLSTGRMRYSILSPSYYEPVLISGGRLGPITASTPSTFVPTARGWYGNAGLWLQIENCFPSQLTGFPTSISASRS